MLSKMVYQLPMFFQNREDTDSCFIPWNCRGVGKTLGSNKMQYLANLMSSINAKFCCSGGRPSWRPLGQVIG